MPHPVQEHRPQNARVSFGVPELDQMLEGGLMPHRPYLLVGPAGTGKTTLALQFLCEGVRRGERGLYVTIEDPPNEVRWDHRALRPNLDAVDVFDAIPDVMRYERVPFKDISAVREVIPFGRVPDRIRLTPEFTSVEVTGTALEQMLRSEVQKRGYVRLVIDSLTALQYFCMKGFDPTTGAQTFLRFLTDLRTTTLLTVESPLEEVESPERMLARGEIRLFRWELDGMTVRAIGVEKFRGSAHDVRLHPYRIGSTGLDIELKETISRDTRRIVEPALTVALTGEQVSRPELPGAAPLSTPLTVEPEPLSVQIHDLVTIGVDITPLRSEVEAALEAARASDGELLASRMARIAAMAVSLAPLGPRAMPSDPAATGPATQAMRRVLARAERIRAGQPPTELPSAGLLARELVTILDMVPPPAPPEARAVPSSVEAPALAPTRRTGPSAPRAPTASPSLEPSTSGLGTTHPVAHAPVPPEPSAAVQAPPSSEAPPASAEPPPLPAAPVPATTVARASALLGEPTVPATPGPDHGTGPAGAGAPGSTPPNRSWRARTVPPLSETPPLPRPVPPPSVSRGGLRSLVGGPGPRTAPTPSKLVESVPAPPGLAGTPPPAVEGTGTTSAPPPKRRRRPSTKSASPAAGPTEPLAPSPGMAAGEASASAKPRRRVARRKKAPPVVAVAPELPPPEVSGAPPEAHSPSPPDPAPPAAGPASGGTSAAEGG